MAWIELIFIVMFLLLASIVACIVGLAAGASRMMRDRPKESDADEARVIQGIHQGLERMEERLEAPETIIMEREEDRSAY